METTDLKAGYLFVIWIHFYISKYKEPASKVDCSFATKIFDGIGRERESGFSKYVGSSNKGECDIGIGSVRERERRSTIRYYDL